MSGGSSQPIPSQWDISSSRGSTLRYLHVNGTRVKYVGPGSDDRDAASIRTNHPIPTDCPIYYYEVEIVNKGRDGFIGIGFSVQEVKLDRLPGWEPHSYGYHGDDGHAFNGRGTGKPYGPIFGTGDWIGVTLNRVEKTLSFSKKGYDLGIAFENVTEDLLYPTVGFRTPDEEIIANFGNDLAANPFKGNFDAIRREAIQRLYRTILAAHVPSTTKSQDPIGELVFNYLTHHGHWQTAAAVARDVLGDSVSVSDRDIQEMTTLRSISDAVSRGDVDEAIAAAEQLAPGVLESYPGVAFKLQCLKFCELIRRKEDEAAMTFGRKILSPTCITDEDRELLEEALTLFAYEDPISCPAAHLLSPQHRNELASGLHRAILAQRGQRDMSALEDVYRQAAAVHAELKELRDPGAMLVEVQELIHKRQDE